MQYNPHRPCSIHISRELGPLDEVASTNAFLHFLTRCKVVLYRKNGAHNHKHITQQTTISTSMKLILAAQVRGAGFNSQWLPTFNTSISVAKLVIEESSFFSYGASNFTNIPIWFQFVTTYAFTSSIHFTRTWLPCRICKIQLNNKNIVHFITKHSISNNSNL